MRRSKFDPEPMTPEEVYKNPKTRALLMNMRSGMDEQTRATKGKTGHIGAATELAFCSECLGRGATVSRPMNSNSRYDAVVDNGQRIYRVQVKTGTENQFDNKFSINTTRSLGKSYGAEEIDLIVASVGRDWLFFDITKPIQSTTCSVTVDYHVIGHEETKNRWDLLGLPAKRINDYS